MTRTQAILQGLSVLVAIVMGACIYSMGHAAPDELNLSGHDVAVIGLIAYIATTLGPFLPGFPQTAANYILRVRYGQVNERNVELWEITQADPTTARLALRPQVHPIVGRNPLERKETQP